MRVLHLHMWWGGWNLIASGLCETNVEGQNCFLAIGSQKSLASEQDLCSKLHFTNCSLSFTLYEAIAMLSYNELHSSATSCWIRGLRHILIYKTHIIHM